MNSKETIADAGNVRVPAYLTLLAKGYGVRCEKQNGIAADTWYAENETVRLVAEDPLVLLGLAAMFEARGSDWKASDRQIEDFLDRFEP
jgi:hypothetical protein